MSQLNRIIHSIETIAEYTGRAVSWLVLLLVLVIGFDVTLRYLFNTSFVAIQELEWHLFALIFMLGAAYTFKHNGHVRVDIFYSSRRLNDRHRAWIDLMGGLFLLLPFCLLIIVSSLPFVMNSYTFSEGSPDPGGLPWRYLLKAMIPIGFSLLLLQGVAHMLRNVRTLIETRSC